MKNGLRTIVYDDALRIEAYYFHGVAQSFPNHFHEHYALGLVERGRHLLSCKGRVYALGPGSVVAFNPGDCHACVQDAGGAFDYRGLNLDPEILRGPAPGKERRRFAQNVLERDSAADRLRILHELILRGAPVLQKQEQLILLLSELCGNSEEDERAATGRWREIEAVCAFLQAHYARRIDIETLCRTAGLSRSTLLRAFLREKGVTPYRYLENVRVQQAARLLREGAAPSEAAQRTGFFDQSHFTNYFSSVTGLTPGLYRGIFCGGTRDSHTREESGNGAAATEMRDGD